ncbi:hypothetical protein WJX84_010517, partial [Apatococcus fuscideae]
MSSPSKQRPWEGQITNQVYSQIAKEEYSEACQLLKDLLRRKPRCQAGQSLLGFCSYQRGDYQAAADSYAALLQLCPENRQYRQDFAKAQLKAGQSEEAAITAGAISSHRPGADLLQLCIKFALNDIP